MSSLELEGQDWGEESEGDRNDQSQGDDGREVAELH